MSLKILMISGKQGSGKTTLQKLIAEAWCVNHNGFVLQMNFADVLYKMHDAVLNVLHYYLPPRPMVKDGPLLQLLGTEWGRYTIDQNIWVKIVQKRIERLRADVNADMIHDALVIIGDCRFENEFDGIPEALRVRLECDREVRKARCSQWRENEHHPSEIGLDTYAHDERFDLRLDSGSANEKMIAMKVLEVLDAGGWVERRKKIESNVKGIFG